MSLSIVKENESALRSDENLLLAFGQTPEERVKSAISDYAKENGMIR